MTGSFNFFCVFTALFYATAAYAAPVALCFCLLRCGFCSMANIFFASQEYRMDIDKIDER